jgi:hypothetical protein
MATVACEAPEDLLPEDEDDDWYMDEHASPSHVSGNTPSFVSGHSAPHGIFKSPSSRSLSTPATSLVSQPSGLPQHVIAGLTHDELRLNAEFTKYVNLVDILLNMREKPPLHRE